MSKFIAYYRVSTARQGASGLGLDAQRLAVQGYLQGGRSKLLTEFTEIESGKRKDRPELNAALALCRIHGATLIIAKLDRLARNVAFISNLMESKVEFVAVDFPQANRLTVHILAAVAEHEAAVISQRTKAALSVARARGVTLGGDRGNIKFESKRGAQASAAVRSTRSRERAADLRPVIESIRRDGFLTLRQICAELTSRGFGSPRGGGWAPAQVRRVLST